MNSAVRLGLGAAALAAGAACQTVAPPPPEAREFKGPGQTLSAVLALGAERLTADQVRTLLVPGQTIESSPHVLPRFKFALHEQGHYSGTSEFVDKTRLYATGSWWVEDSGRACFIYRGEYALAPYPTCFSLYVLNGRYYSAEKDEPSAPVAPRFFGRPF